MAASLLLAIAQGKVAGWRYVRLPLQKLHPGSPLASIRHSRLSIIREPRDGCVTQRPTENLRTSSAASRFATHYSGKKLLHSSTTHCGSFHDIADALSQHPGIVAVTGTGGIGLLAGLHRSPAIWKLIAKASADRSVLLLPQKPSHSFQSRKHDVRKLQSLFKLLRKQERGNVAVAVYITGRPGFGKTQLAREFGNTYYHQKRGYLFKNLVVGTLNASSKHTFLQSYIALALELGCGAELKALENFSGRKGELQSLELLSATVRRELRRRPGWLLVVDNLSSDVKSVHESQSVNSLPVVTPSSLPYSPQGIGRDGLLGRGGAGGVAAAYGVANTKAAWSSFWPQPGDEGWGKGYIVVTTHDRRLVERSCPSASELYLSEGMGTRDAVALLEKVSGLKADGASEVVNILEGIPLSIARFVAKAKICV